MPVTIKDIARAAGVSHATVSRALNGNTLIPEKTAVSIRNLAEKMGYMPSAAARGLKTHRSRVLGVIVSRIDNPYFGEVVQGIEDALQNKGYSIFIASSNLDRAQEKTIVQAFCEHRVDGVIIGSVHFSREYSNSLKKHGIPIVVINNQSPRDYDYSIAHDDVVGAREVTDHLIQLGHTRIAYIGDDRAGRINRDRMRGFRQSMQSAGLPMEEEWTVTAHGSGIEQGSEGMDLLLNLPNLPTAIFCFNDLMAIGALKLMQQRGIAVPDQIALAGFDNISYSAYTTPALTTFDQPKRQIGSEAARILLDLIQREPGGNGHEPRGNGNEPPPTQLIRGQLLVRESTTRFTRKEKP